MKMSKNNSVVPQARAALDRFNPEVARDVGVNLKQGYNGNLTAKRLHAKWLLQFKSFDIFLICLYYYA